VLLGGSVATDLALRTALASLISTTMLASDPVRRLRRERSKLEFYAELGDAADPAAVFAQPGEVAVEVTARRGRVEVLRFPSPYATLNPRVREAYARHGRNGVAHAQHWRHVDGPRPTLFVVHGFGASPAWFNAWFFSLREFFHDGWDVVLFTLPFHGARASSRLAVNGTELFAHGVAGFNEGILHGMYDLRALLRYVRSLGAPRIGVTGLSLGGYVSALLAALEPELDFAIPNAAVVSLPDLMPGWFPANVTTAVMRRVAGVPNDLVERAMALHSPLSYPAAVPKDRLMVVGGLGDRLAPPEQSLLLWEHWGRPRLHWFAGSHVLHFGRSGYLGEMRELMRSAPPAAAPSARTRATRRRPGSATS
jgi:pimeloyl-ACP methyl ester carboxylesterase